MAGLFNDDVERNSALSESSPIKSVVYGTIEPVGSSSGESSLVQNSPVERPRPGYTFPHQHRIIPPSIKGHGRLIVAHRTVPYWVGAVFVVGSVAWAVWCAIYLYHLLGGRPNDWKFGSGEGW
ncbi:hypothetical protein IQ06DRAFT_289743 [Phaeosphaeriaceae sp. SRC1lsM3a]|nr:hypothetical protein IQ06DRAFT_289743 [Stagonospora sp. SRC1lsM3a]